MIVIKNGLLVDANKEIEADILIDGSKIIAIGHGLEAGKVIDARGKVVMPAFVDSHAHFRDPGFEYKEDLESGSRAALKGGYSAVCLMANTNPTVDNHETYTHIKNKAEDIGLIEIIQNYAVTKGLLGEKYINLDSLPKSVRFISDDGHGLNSNKETFKLFQRLSKTDLTLMVHEEDKGLSEIDYRLGEDVHTFRDVYFAGKTGARVHFSHVSTKESAKAIKYGKRQNYNISMEVTPHHIYMTGSDYKVNPPIRKEEDRKYLIESIIDGTVDCIGTDHAPHSEEDKDKGAPGMIGLETAFQIVYRVLVEEYGQDLQLVSKVLSAGPAKILGLNKGYLDPSYDSDIVILDLNKKETIKKENIGSKSKNSPFIGQTFTGLVDTTIVGGKVMYEVDK